MGVVVRDGEWLRLAVGDDGRVGHGGDVHGAGDGAESGDGDTDGDVGDRRDEVGVGDDHDYGERAGGPGERDDFAEGNGIGAEPVGGIDGDGDERCGRSGRDVERDVGDIQRANGYDGDLCGSSIAGRGHYD